LGKQRELREWKLRGITKTLFAVNTPNGEKKEPQLRKPGINWKFQNLNWFEEEGRKGIKEGIALRNQ